jgi:hypothetical protein
VRAVRVGQRLIEPISLRFEADHLTREPSAAHPDPESAAYPL